MQPTQSSTPSDLKQQSTLETPNVKSSYLFKEYHALKNEFKNTNIANINKHYLNHQRNSPLLESSQQMASISKNSDNSSQKHVIMSKRIQSFLQESNVERGVDHAIFNKLVREQQDQIRVNKKRYEHQNTEFAVRPPKSK